MPACQTLAHNAPAPAVLVKQDAQSMEAIKIAVAKAMQSKSAVIEAADLTQQSSLTALPAKIGNPYSDPGFGGNQTALPTQFELMIDGQGCYLVQLGHNEPYRLDGVACRKIQN